MDERYGRTHGYVPLCSRPIRKIVASFIILPPALLLYAARSSVTRPCAIGTATAAVVLVETLPVMVAAVAVAVAVAASSVGNGGYIGGVVRELR